MDPKSPQSPDPESELSERPEPSDRQFGTDEGGNSVLVLGGGEDMSYRELEIKRLDNVQFLTRVMNFSPKGGLVQAFIVEAIRAYCEAIVKEPKPSETGDGVISRVAWWELAADVKRQFDEKYGRGPEEEATVTATVEQGVHDEKIITVDPVPSEDELLEFFGSLDDNWWTAGDDELATQLRDFLLKRLTTP